jgi:hypothetical protein
MLSLSRLIFRRPPPCAALPLCRFSAAVAGDGQGDKESSGTTKQPQPAVRSIWASPPPLPSAGAASRPKRSPAAPARDAAEAPAGSDGAAGVPRRTGSWRPGQQQQQPPRTSAAGLWRPGAAATPNVLNGGRAGGSGWKPVSDGAADAAGSAMDFGGDMDMIAGGDGGRRRSGFSGKRRSSHAEGSAPQWKRSGQQGGGSRFTKGREGGKRGGAAGWGSAKERIDSVTGRENYFSALISAKRTTKVTKGGKTRTAQVSSPTASVLPTFKLNFRF